MAGYFGVIKNFPVSTHPYTPLQEGWSVCV